MMRSEQEVVIRWDAQDKLVSLYSCMPGVWRRCEKAGWALKGETRSAHGRVLSREYEAPLELFRFRCLSAEKRAQQAQEASRRARESGFGKSPATTKQNAMPSEQGGAS